MTRAELIGKIANAIEHEEGFHVTRQEAVRRGIAWPTRAQRNLNPGNIRRWGRHGKSYPQVDGFVNFRALRGLADHERLAEARRVLATLIGQYIDGKYTHGKQPTLLEMFEAYAPGRDGNNPARYALSVAKQASLPVDVPMVSLYA